MEQKDDKYLYTICKYIYLCSVPNFWSERLDWPDRVIKVFDKIYSPNSVIIIAFIMSEFLAYLTQKHLTEKQEADLMMFCISHSLLYGSHLASVAFYRDEIKSIVHSLAISLKEVFNDREVEKKMIKKSKIYGLLYFLYVIMVLMSYWLEGILQATIADATFTTVITAWPETNETGKLAGFARVIIFFVWILFILRQSALYFLLLVLTICLSHQYVNLQQYFYSLKHIFEKDCDQSSKEAMYERSLKIGIRIHAETLRCTKEAQKAFQILYCGQIVLTIIVLTLQMVQITASDRSFSKTLTTLSIGGSVLFITGMFMWNAGDITVEASRLPEAMFLSGWHNCRGATGYRVRRLLVMAMAQGQIPVVMKVLGILELSYASYVSIVKTSYSVFSVLY